MTVADAIAVAFRLGLAVGSAATLAVGLAAYAAWKLLPAAWRDRVASDRAARAGQPAGPNLPPPGHPEHPDLYSSDWARWRFEDLRIQLDDPRKQS